jgi:hypothetical protein
MYSPRVTESQILKTAKALGQPLKYSTPSEISIYRQHLDSLYEKDEKGNYTLTRPFTVAESRWVTNEQALCTLDFRYWANNYARIKSKENIPIHFYLNDAQKVMIDVWGEMEEEEIAIMVQILKARQLGMSTLTEMAVTHRVQFHSHINAVVASSDPDKSRKMAEMMVFCWDQQPLWLMPQRKSGRAGILHEFANGSAVSIQWGNQSTGIARGTTPTIAHLSELADFEHPDELVDASLMRAMHDSPFVLLVLESTASGRDNWWHRKWNLSKRGWPQRRSRLRPVFLPWYLGRDLYPNPTWLKKSPVPEGYKFPQNVEDHAARANAYVEANPTLQKVLGKGWEMPPEQKWFYEVNREEYASEGNLNKWYQEMPADDLEAFQHKRMSVFAAEFLEEKRNACKAPLLVLGLQGPEDELPLRLQPTEREIDYNSPFKPLVLNAARITGGKDSTAWKLVPIRWTGGSEQDPLGKIFIYSLPEKFNEYGLGIDTAHGIGYDRTVIQVLRKATPYANAEQCAEFATDQAGAFEIWPYALALGTLYSTVGHDGQQFKAARMVIEMAANGEATQRELIKRGWPASAFHIQMKPQVRGMVPTNQTMPLFGWKTTEATRPAMLDFLMKSLKDSWLDVNSPHFVDEMGNFIRNEKKERLEAAEGAKDDRIMAMGIVLDSMHRPELYKSATPSWQARLQAEAASRYKPRYRPGWNQTGQSALSPEDLINVHNEDRFSDYS